MSREEGEDLTVAKRIDEGMAAGKPDSISMSEGMPSFDGFSRLLRKLAKGYLLVESFSARW
jgi:hypothetical protein